MVILDKMNLPSKKIMISIVVIILLAVFSVFGFLHKQKMDVEKRKAAEQQRIQKEMNDQSSYDSTLSGIFGTADLNSMINLYGLLLKDFSFMQAAGWQKDEVLCNKNSCNIRFKKMKGRAFQYISLKKEDKTYEPIFNEESLTYEGLIYDINLASNERFKDNLDTIFSCTEFISNTYQLNSIQPAVNELTIQLPQNVFSFSKEYDWATFSGIKKGVLKYVTPDFYTLNYIKDKYMGQLFSFEQMTIKGSEIDVTFNFYCF